LSKFNKIACVLALLMGLVFSFGSSAFASTPNVDFIDVSHHNNEFGLPLAFYQTLKSGGVNSVVVKVSEGEYYVDPASSVNVANAKQAGMIVHAYHFARFTSTGSAKAEAHWFDMKLQLVGFDKKKDGYVVVDVEASNLSKDSTDLTLYTNSFIGEMNRLGYSKIDIYTGSYFYNNRLKPNSLIVNKPWLAAYPANPVKDQPTANFSNGKGAWQWTSSYTGMLGYGRFDASEDYAGKYTNQTKSSTPEVKQIGSLSLVDYLKANSLDASFANRSKIAGEYGIVGYFGTSAQNLALLSKLKSGVKPAKVNIDNSELTTSPTKEQSATSAPASTGPKTTASTYIVKPGDSLSKIAKKFGTTISVLASSNNIKNINVIKAGQVHKVTGSAKTSVSSIIKIQYYTVKKRDTVSVIAKRYGSTSAQIKSWDKLDGKYTIYAGKTIRVK
jgi:LysM repeat protein/GH25 family lysozyme M1 (1,4-beta-N-acetylmuramidase)